MKKFKNQILPCKLLLVFLIISFPSCLFSQLPKPDIDFSNVDSLARTVKYKNDLSRLSNDLTKNYTKQIFKARAIFKWITDNIEYDYKFYNKYNYKGREPKTFECRDDKDCDAKKTVWEIRYIDKVLRKKKTVCAGYAMLFKKMCDIAGLKSEVVEGYVRTKYYQVGGAGNLDHAWNVIWLDSAYYLLDATWAAGGCSEDENGKLLFFSKSYNDYYWLTPADDFARNHYPKDSKWVLENNYTKEKFSTNPYYSPLILSDIKLMSPNTGIINAKQADTIKFQFCYYGNIEKLQINSNFFRNPDIWIWGSKRKKKKIPDSLAVKKQQYIKFDHKGCLYEFNYVVPSNSIYYLDILFDNNRAMRFKVNIIASS